MGVVEALILGGFLVGVARHVFIVTNGEERGNLMGGDWWLPRLVGTLTLFGYVFVVYWAIRMVVTAW